MAVPKSLLGHNVVVFAPDTPVEIAASVLINRLILVIFSEDYGTTIRPGQILPATALRDYSGTMRDIEPAPYPLIVRVDDVRRVSDALSHAFGQIALFIPLESEDEPYRVMLADRLIGEPIGRRLADIQLADIEESPVPLVFKDGDIADADEAESVADNNPNRMIIVCYDDQNLPKGVLLHGVNLTGYATPAKPPRRVCSYPGCTEIVEAAGEDRCYRHRN